MLRLNGLEAIVKKSEMDTRPRAQSAFFASHKTCATSP